MYNYNCKKQGQQCQALDLATWQLKCCSSYMGKCQMSNYRNKKWKVDLIYVTSVKSSTQLVLVVKALKAYHWDFIFCFKCLHYKKNKNWNYRLLQTNPHKCQKVIRHDIFFGVNPWTCNNRWMAHWNVTMFMFDGEQFI